MVTKRGVCYTLTQSPYKVPYQTSRGVMILHFSTINHKEKFIEMRESNRTAINASLSGRFGITVELDLLADIVLYKRVETRGFCISINGGFVQCPEDLIFNGMRLSGNG